MSIRDEEIKRLTFYAKGLGVKVTIWNKRKSGAAAEWTLDGSQIEVYAAPGTSKTEVILSLIHELGHHVWFIHEKERQPDLKFEEAIERENLVEENSKTPAPKHLRKKIYDVEKASTEWWLSIYKETDIKIPEWKLRAAMEFDMWMYEEYYETGFFPKGRRRREKYKEVQSKHRGT